MKQRINILRNTYLSIILFFGGLSSCTTDMIEKEITNDNALFALSPVELLATKGSATEEKVPDNTYYLSYPLKDGTKLFEVGIKSQQFIVENTSSTTFDTGIYWFNIKKDDNSNKATFTLSNMKTETAADCTPGKDILWDTQSTWLSDVSFKLSHRMAKVQVDLTNSINGQTITSVCIESIKNSYTFSRKEGNVTPTDETSTLSLTVSTSSDPDINSYIAILPPQKRATDMKLVVTLANGNKYSRHLPYSMLYKESDILSYTRELEFMQGYNLILTAQITDNPDLTVFFTGATLKNWEWKGEYPTIARPAGIYSLTELKDWIAKYNTYKLNSNKETQDALRRYGVLSEDDSKWTFTLYHSLSISNGETISQVTDFTDTFTHTNNYTITGKTEEELFGHSFSGTVTDAIFSPQTNP